MRVLSGMLKPDATMLNASTGGTERLGKIHSVVGKDHEAGGRGARRRHRRAAKLKATLSGHTLSDEKHAFLLSAPELPPALFSRGVRFDAKGGEDKVGNALYRLDRGGPGLSVHQDASTARARRLGPRRPAPGDHGGAHPPRASASTAGSARRTSPTRRRSRRRPPNIEGKHKKQTGGHGQFGVCYIDMEPMPRGGGFVFEDAVVGGAVPRQFIPSVEKGIVKSMAQGVLAGYPMIDVKVRLFDGKYHDVDSSDAAFQMAGSKAFKAAAAQCAPVLLEPIVQLSVTVPSVAMGDIIGDINSRRGSDHRHGLGRRARRSSTRSSRSPRCSSTSRS